MKLISCYIENFGNLSKKTIDFDSNITSIYQVNGTGKSTLASFIKAMFYGLDTFKSNTTTFVDRMHYYPFNGQSFGGNITFIYNNITYKIERFFDEKSEKKDTFKVYENGNVTDKFTSSIGEEIFGINKVSFERLLFINDEDIEIKTNSSINAKLNTLLEGRDDSDLDSILQLLEKKSKVYKDSKSQSSFTCNAKEELKVLKNDLVYNKKILEALKDKYVKLDNLKNQLNDLKKKQNDLTKLNEYKVKCDTYNSYLLDIKELENKLKAIKDKYPNGVLTIHVIDLLKSNVNERIENQLILNNKKLSSEQEYEYSLLNEKFENNIISDEKISELSRQINDYNDLVKEINDLSNVRYDEDLLSLEKKFSNNLPTNEDFNKIEEKINSLKKDKEIYQSMDTYLNVEQSVDTNKKPNKVYLILAIIFLTLLFTSIPMFFIKLVLGIIVLSVSFIGLLVVSFIYLNNKQNNIQKTQINKQNINQDKVNLNTTNNANEMLIKSFFVKFNYPEENSVEVLLYSLKGDIRKYNKHLLDKENNENSLKDANQKMIEIKNQLDQFFTKYKVVELNYQTSLIKLKEQLNSYKLYTTLLEGQAKENNLAIEKIYKNNKLIEEICEKYELEVSNIDTKLEDIIMDSNSYSNLNKSLEDLNKKALDYKVNNKIDKVINIPLESIDEISKNIEELEEKKATLITEISDDEAKVSTYGDDENKIENLEQQIKEYKSKYDIFEKTIYSLKKAEQNLKDKYIGPVKEKFVTYANMIESIIGEKVSMSKDFEIYYEVNGKNRSEKHLSSGLKSICALCFRLALLDNMYIDEKPFIILDDPFALLDETHMDKAKEIINKLSSEVQIIYITCHESRKI